MRAKRTVPGIAMLCILLLALSACAAKERMMGKLHTEKLADYLYYMDLDEYDFSMLPQNESPLFNGGCSSVRKGDFYGRNLDLGYCETPEFIIHVDAAPGRFESIGVCADPTITCDAGEMTEAELRAMPNITNDGINENGVIISENIVNTAGVDDMSGTAPGKEKIHSSRVVRYLLDRAESAQHAVELMRELDIVGGFSGCGLHWMIADEADTYVVEIINGEIAASRNEQFYLTNFYLNYGPVQKIQLVADMPVENVPLLTDFAIGVERWCVLREHYDGISSAEDMAELLETVKATAMYDETVQPAWYSECTGEGLTIRSSKTDFEKAIAAQRDLFTARDRRNPQGDWITWHSSVYDIKNRSLCVYSQEDYSESYRYALGN